MGDRLGILGAVGLFLFLFLFSHFFFFFFFFFFSKQSILFQASFISMKHLSSQFPYFFFSSILYLFFKPTTRWRQFVAGLKAFARGLA
jgi:hypothetical protein